MDLLSASADRAAARAFADAVFLPGATRVVVRERDRAELVGTLPGEGYSLMLEVLWETGQRARLNTWQVDVRRMATGDGNERWGIAAQQSLTVLAGLYRLSLNPARQYAARDLVIESEDLRLSMPEGTVFVAEPDGGQPTAVVLLGRGEMAFSPSPAAEKGQVRIFAGGDTLQTPFDALFLRVNPNDFASVIRRQALTERPVDPRELRRADEIFRQELPRSFGLDLGDLSAEPWSLLPNVGDIVVEIRTRRFETLTFARAAGEVEDISLFDRKNRRNISTYSSVANRQRFGRFYNEDDRADFIVRNYDIEASFNPSRRQIEGDDAHGDRGAGRRRLGADAPPGGIPQRAVDLLQRVRPALERPRPQPEQHRHQPAVGRHAGREDDALGELLGGPAAATGGPGGPCALSAVHSRAGGTERAAGRGQPPLQQPQLLVRAAARHHLLAGHAAADGAGELRGRGKRGTPGRRSPCPTPRGAGRSAEFRVTTPNPARYLSCLITPLGSCATRRCTSRAVVEPFAATRRAGRLLRRREAAVGRRSRGCRRARASSPARPPSIIKFYASLAGDAPYPTLTLALIEPTLPGGHSPAYIARGDAAGRWLAAELPATTRPRFDGLPGVLPRPRGRAPVVGAGRGLEELPRAVAQRGVRAVLRRAVRREGPRPGRLRPDDAADARASASSASDQGPIFLGYRIGHIQNDGRALPRGGLQQVRGGAAHAPPAGRATRRSSAACGGSTTDWRFRKAGTEDLRARDGEPRRAPRSTASSSAGSTATPFP